MTRAGNRGDTVDATQRCGAVTARRQARAPWDAAGLAPTSPASSASLPPSLSVTLVAPSVLSAGAAGCGSDDDAAVAPPMPLAGRPGGLRRVKSSTDVICDLLATRGQVGSHGQG